MHVNGARHLPLATRLRVRTLPSFPVVLLLVLSIVLGGGCGVGDFVGAYFNTYYNAQKLFSEAEEEVLTQQRDPRTVGQKVFLPPFVVSPSAKTKFTSVIEKCSKLLQYHPGSNLVDDALMLIGKSYYYQNDNPKAERKFVELVETFPQSDLVLEARVLLAYSYYRMDDKVKSGAAANELLEAAEEAGEREYSAKASLLLGQLEVERENIEQAKAHYQNVAQVSGEAEQRARAFMSVGDLSFNSGDYAQALKSYRSAEDASSDYLAEYRARIAQGRSLSKLGEYEEALDLLDDLRSNSNFREFYGEIDFESGNTYRDMGETDEAVHQYIFVDTTYARTEVSAKSHYELGLLYETKLFLYDSARVTYNKGRNEFPQSDVTALIVARAEYMNKYRNYTTEIGRLDSIRRFILYPPPDTAMVGPDSTQADSLLASDFEGRDSAKVNLPRIPPPPLDTVEAQLANNITELAVLFQSTIGVPDSAEKWYRRLLIDHPRSKGTPLALFTLAQIAAQDSARPRSVSDSLYREIIDRYPETEFAAEARKRLGLPEVMTTRDRVEAAYLKAEQLLQGGKPKEAIAEFHAIVDRYPESSVASKAQFAVGWIYERVSSQPDSAIKTYRRLVESYPNSQYASLVKPMLAEVDMYEKAMQDSAARDSARRSEKQGGTGEGSVKPEREKVSEVLDPGERPELDGTTDGEDSSLEKETRATPSPKSTSPLPTPPKDALPTPASGGEQPMPTPAGADSGKFTIQVSSWQTESKAQAEVSRLSREGFQAYVHESTVEGTLWFRVRVGRFSTLREATAGADSLRRVVENEVLVVPIGS